MCANYRIIGLHIPSLFFVAPPYRLEAGHSYHITSERFDQSNGGPIHTV